jgi:HMG (high mobility group) box
LLVNFDGSAYNIFFKDERANLLAERQINDPAIESVKIGFEAMAKTIGKRWKELGAEELSRYKELAKVDTERYRAEMDAYNHDLAMNGRREREEASRKRMENAGIQPASQAGIPSFGGSGFHQTQQQQQRQQPIGGETTGELAGTYLLGHASADPLHAQLQATATGMGNAAVSQLDLLLAEALQQPGFQGLSGILSTTPQGRSSLQDYVLMNSLEQQQQNIQRMEGRLGQGRLSHHQPIPSTPAPIGSSLVASVSQHGASPASQLLMATLRLQTAQQLIVKSMQGRNGSNASWGA